jgi:protein SCO1/2
MRRAIIGTLGLVLVLAAAGATVRRESHARLPALPFYADSALTPVWTADTGGMHRIESFSLVDQGGHSVNEMKLDGKVTVVTFFYATCKDLCPRLQSRLAAVRGAFNEDPRVQLLSISVSPEHDTAPVLAAYAAANHVSAPDWLLLTGARDEIDRVARQSFFATTPMPRASPATHGETIWLIDSSRRIRGLYNGTLPLDSKRLMEDVATLIGPRGS